MLKLQNLVARDPVREATHKTPFRSLARSRFARSKILAMTLLVWTLPGQAVDLSSVYEIARVNDPVIGAARYGYDAQRQAAPQARAALLPSLALNGATQWNERNFLVPNSIPIEGANPGDPTTFVDPDQEFNTHSWNAQLRQSVFNLSNWHTWRSAKAQIESAQWDLAASEQELLIRVATAYLDVLRAQDFLDSSLAQEAAVKRQLEQVQQRFEVGLVAITDVLESTAIYDDAVVQRIQADGNHDNFFDTLTTLTGESFVELSKLSEQLPVVSPAPANPEDWVAAALEGNFGVLSAQASVRSARRTLRARRADYLPTIDATVTLTHNVDDSISFFGQGTKINQDIYALEMSLPIYQGGFTTARSREARARFRQATQQLESQHRSVSRDVRNLYRSVNADVIRVKARLKAIRSSESALEATETGYEVGTRNIVDVLQAQQRLYSAQFDYADSRYTYVLNLLRLKQAAGTLTPQDLADINAFMNSGDTVRRLASLRRRSGGNAG